jgi:site-specific DNA-methyltransferase (adenine-specific)
MIEIFNKDCIEALKQLPEESADCIITDPPYGINYLSNHYKNKNPHKAIINDDTLFVPIDELWRILKPTGCMFIFYSHKVPLIDKRVKNVIIWRKNNWTAGDLEGDFGNRYECIAFMPKDKFKLYSTKRYDNIWNFDKVPHDRLRHPTEKPEPLIRQLIECGCPEGGIVLDPFLGSGTTAVACRRLGRNFIGYEIVQEYCDIALKRLKDINNSTLKGYQ